MDQNVNVWCTRARHVCSGPRFVTSFSSLLANEAKCPECGETWAVHMYDEEDRLLHPTEMCPTCFKPALLRERCRCSRYCIKCANGHEWHTCKVHKVQVVGGGHDPKFDGKRCTCPPENN